VPFFFFLFLKDGEKTLFDRIAASLGCCAALRPSDKFHNNIGFSPSPNDRKTSSWCFQKHVAAMKSPAL